jgi:glutamate synthase (NADPH/NADH) small chain
VEVPDRAFVVPADTLIVAIGTQPNPLLRQTTAGLETDSRGCLITRNEAGLTSREHVYAGGDAVTGAATVILAMGAGKHAAAAIHQSLTD